MLYLFKLLCVCLIGNIEAFSRIPNNIHQFMTAPELGFYFGSIDHDDVPEYQIVYMPVLMPKSAQKMVFGEEDEFNDDDDPINYGFRAFGRNIDLSLKPNRNLIAPNFKFNRRTSSMGEPEAIKLDERSDCHYLHKEAESVAAISMCQDQIIHGLVFLDNATYEIRPLTQRLKSFVKLSEALEMENSDEIEHGVPHIVKKASMNHIDFGDDFLTFSKDLRDYPNSYETFDDASSSEEYDEDFSTFRVKRQESSNVYTIEVAMFFDEAGYKIFAPYFNNNDKEMRDMLLAYLNGVQALYHHPSLGTSVELTLVRLDLFQRQPADMPHYGGERSKLLDSFCDYQKKINPSDDTNPDHWDMGLYISGLDFYAIENGRKSGVTMGLAAVGGVCIDQYACVIAELGTTNVFGKPYPSAGFASVYVLAHEIGHNLGMHHDSSGNSCPKDGYIMSPSRGTNGETVWSSCSASVMKNIGSYKCLLDKPGSVTTELNHNQYNDAPGQAWGAKKQCEILLRDKDAHVTTAGSSLSGICQQLQCRTPHRSGYYFAGPALEGTDCGNGLWCKGGECVKMDKGKPSTVEGGWSKWKSSECNSGCIIKSKGYLTKQRTCNDPEPVNTDEGCEGNSFEVNLCKDDKICRKKKRVSANDYASYKCAEFSRQLPELDPNGFGLQAFHEDSRLWMACAIFCKRSETGGYYTPRYDLNDMGVDPYFPDGTWCHNNGKENFYCIQHHCLPESFKFSKLWGSLGEDIPLSWNARPNSAPLPTVIKKYLSLGPDGKPLLTTLDPEQDLHPTDDDWSSHDYVEIPASIENQWRSIGCNK